MQAFSRTNRILNSVKTFGNIVCFPVICVQEVDDALALLFGDKDAKGTVVLVPYAGISRCIHREGPSCAKQFPLGEEIVGEQAQKDSLTPVRLDFAAATSCRLRRFSPMMM